jgi:hypothetical protein
MQEKSEQVPLLRFPGQKQNGRTAYLQEAVRPTAKDRYFYDSSDFAATG